jgi:hypothetical protein
MIHAIRARMSLVPDKRVVAELFETIVSFMQVYLARVLALLLVKFAVVQEQEKGTCCSASQFFSNITTEASQERYEWGFELIDVSEFLES